MFRYTDTDLQDMRFQALMPDVCGATPFVPRSRGKFLSRPEALIVAGADPPLAGYHQDRPYAIHVEVSHQLSLSFVERIIPVVRGIARLKEEKKSCEKKTYANDVSAVA